VCNCVIKPCMYCKLFIRLLDLMVISCPSRILYLSMSLCIILLWQSFTQLFFTTAVGITNQRETTVTWDKQTGAPLHNAIGTVCDIIFSLFK
jgi:hypothetical protein